MTDKKKKITVKMKKEYLRGGGVVCPFCGAQGIEGVCGVDVESGIATQRVSCNECGEVWQDVYLLKDIMEVT